MFIVFSDQNNNIINNKVFNKLILQVNGYDTIESTYELLKYDTIKVYGNIKGYYYINLENFDYQQTHLFDTMINFSYIDNVRLRITSTEQYANAGLKIHVGCISYNCLRYINKCVDKKFNN
jgi:hypothetical protein